MPIVVGLHLQIQEELMDKIQAHSKDHGFEQIPDELLAKIKGSIKEQ